MGMSFRDHLELSKDMFNTKELSDGNPSLDVYIEKWMVGHI